MTVVSHVFGRAESRTSVAPRRDASRHFRYKPGHYASTPSGSMESKNVSDFLYEIARPFASCNLCKSGTQDRRRRQLAAATIPSKSRALLKQMLRFVDDCPTFHLSQRISIRENIVPERTRIPYTLLFFSFFDDDSVKITISKRMNKYAWIFRMDARFGKLSDVSNMESMLHSLIYIS